MPLEQVAVGDYCVHLLTSKRRLRKGAVGIFDDLKLLELLHIHELAAEAGFWLRMQLLEPLLAEKPARGVNSPNTHTALSKWEANDFDFP